MFVKWKWVKNLQLTCRNLVHLQRKTCWFHPQQKHRRRRNVERKMERKTKNNESSSLIIISNPSGQSCACADCLVADFSYFDVISSFHLSKHSFWSQIAKSNFCRLIAKWPSSCSMLLWMYVREVAGNFWHLVSETVINLCKLQLTTIPHPLIVPMVPGKM